MSKIFTLILLFLAIAASADNFRTVSSGNWDDFTIWQDGNIAPLVGNNNVIIVSAGDNVVLNNNIVFGNGCELCVAGNLIINGDLTALNNLIINVSGSLIINGSINVNNGGEISIYGNVSVSDDVTFSNNGSINMNSGYLDIGGNLSGGSGGEITGNGVIDIGGSNTFDTTPPAGVNVNSGLPVSMVDFAAGCEGGEIIVYWSTASESNNAYFVVERSADLHFWEPLGVMPGAGNSNILLQYTYIDQQPLEGNNYYRIIQFDFDGQFEVFGPVSANSSNYRMKTEIFPNPFSESLVISFSDEIPTNAVLQIANTNGQVVLIRDTKNDVFQNAWNLDVSDLPSGIYFLSVQADGFYQISKILKTSL